MADSASDSEDKAKNALRRSLLLLAIAVANLLLWIFLEWGVDMAFGDGDGRITNVTVSRALWAVQCAPLLAGLLLVSVSLARALAWRELLLTASSVLFALLVLELAIRFLVLTDVEAGVGLRRPEVFADPSYDADYWKLHYLWSDEFPPADHPHPRLGWAGSFDRTTLVHNEAGEVGDRRPVLLYGDSFASCATEDCFQDILNGDPEFSGDHFLLNYGVGGYGLCQMSLLLEESLDAYEEPFVVFSFMTWDLERTALPIRVSQKPYYAIGNGGIELRGLPIAPDQSTFFEANPSRIRSYLFRALVHSRLFPGPLRSLSSTEPSAAMSWT